MGSALAPPPSTRRSSQAVGFVSLRRTREIAPENVPQPLGDRWTLGSRIADTLLSEQSGRSPFIWGLRPQTPPARARGAPSPLRARGSPRFARSRRTRDSRLQPRWTPEAAKRFQAMRIGASRGFAAPDEADQPQLPPSGPPTDVEQTRSRCRTTRRALAARKHSFPPACMVARATSIIGPSIESHPLAFSMRVCNS